MRSSAVVGTVLSAALIGAGAAGCGTSAPAGPPVASVSVTVPVNGALLFVSRVKLVGTVASGVQRIRVAGHRVRVRRGAFAVSVRLHRGRNRIRILAAAPGFVPTRSWLTLRYSPHGFGSGPSLADRVNGVCTANTNQTYLLVPDTGQPPSLPVYKKLVAAFGAEVARLRTFDPPARQRAAYGEFRAADETAVSEFHALLTETSVAAARRDLTVTIAAVKHRDAVGSSLGFFDCVGFLKALSVLQAQ
ncbi:MAG TPA: hypothetical protein VGG87_01750, partial [Solirubrobacteraceae bacterium]